MLTLFAPVGSVLSVALAACGGATTDAGSNGGGTGGGGTVTMSASSAALSVFLGGSVTSTITITRVNYDGVVTLNATLTDPRQTGVTVAVSPVSLSGSTVSSTLTVTAAADAPLVGGGISLVATGPDSLRTFLLIPLSLGRPQVTVARTGTGTGTVTSTPSGINCGSACNSAFPLGTNVTLTATPATGSAFGGWFGGGCTGTSPTCSLAVTAAPTITATFNSTAQSFSLGLGLATANVQQGGNATSTATITRNNGFAGTVTFAFNGAPTGLTIGANPAGATDNTATINIAATSALAAGNYPITVTATSAGVPTQTATLNVQVTPGAGGSGNVAMSFAGCDPSEVPIWVAAQNGTGPWTRVTMGANSTFTFAAGVTGGIAMVKPDGGGFNTTVFYGSRDDIATLALGRMCTGINGSVGTQQLSGTLTGIATTLATISVGGAYTEFPIQQGLSFMLNQVPAGRRDLIATATNVNPTNGGRAIARMILRRDVTYTGTVPQLNFNGPEYFMPVNRLVTTNNLAGDQSYADASFYTINGSSATYSQRLGGLVGVSYAGVPDSLLRPGDLHVIQVVAAPPNGTSGRLAIVLRRSAVDDTVDFGPPLTQPTVTSLGTTPYVRLRAQLASQSAYSGAASADFSQNLSSVSVTTTVGYISTVPATWTVDIPDLTAAGYDPAWGLRSGSPVNWEVFAVAGTVLPFFGATPADGNRILGAFVTSTSSAAIQLRRFKRW
jgi:hypothetical protein